MSDVDTNVPQQETSADADFDSAFAEFSGTPVDDEQEASVEEVTETQEVTEAPETEPEKDDPFSGLSESQKQYFAELQKKAGEADHTIKSQIGRVSALQKKINELESLKSAPAATQETPMPGDAEWESLKSDYPQIATLVEKRIAALDKVMSERVGQATQPIKELQHERYINGQYAALHAAHPDYESVVNESSFRSWLSEQPPQIQAFAASDDAQEASYLLTTYKAVHKPAVASGPSAVAEIKEQRKAKLEAATGIQSRGANNPSVGGAPADFEAAFEFFSRKSR